MQLMNLTHSQNYIYLKSPKLKKYQFLMNVSWLETKTSLRYTSAHFNIDLKIIILICVR